jgi:hypothetical protein
VSAQADTRRAAPLRRDFSRPPRDDRPDDDSPGDDHPPHHDHPGDDSLWRRFARRTTIALATIRPPHN